MVNRRSAPAQIHTAVIDTAIALLDRRQRFDPARDMRWFVCAGRIDGLTTAASRMPVTHDLVIAMLHQLLDARAQHEPLTELWWVVEGQIQAWTAVGAALTGSGLKSIRALTRIEQQEAGMDVVNTHTHQPTAQDVYVGRGSILGNQWSHLAASRAPYPAESRQDAVLAYAQWLWQRIHAGDPRILRALRSMPDDAHLVCFCAPALCHGEVIVHAIDYLNRYGWPTIDSTC